MLCMQGNFRFGLSFVFHGEGGGGGGERGRVSLGRGGGGEYSKEFYTERLCPEAQPFTLLYTRKVRQKSYPFRIPSIDK